MEFLHANRDWFIGFSLMLSVPSVALYCSELAVIVRNRQFHNSFYALFCVRAIVDFLAWLNSLYGYRLPCLFGAALFPIYKQLPNGAVALYFFLNYFTFHADNLAVELILLNRLSAIALPFAHKKLWHRILPFTLAIFLIPFIYYTFIFRMDAEVILLPDEPMEGATTLLLVEGETTHYLVDNTIILAVCSIVFLLSCLLANLFILAVYKCKHIPLTGDAQAESAVGNLGRNLMDSMERKLLIYAIATFLSHLLVAFMMIGLTIYAINGDKLTFGILFSQAPWMADLVSLVQPSWMLLWASSQFRAQWAKEVLPEWAIPLWRKIRSPCKKISPALSQNNQLSNHSLNVHVQYSQNPHVLRRPFQSVAFSNS